ncbi:MAG: CheC domain protein [Deltaproteobacteria bacterium]|jgi:chemotaxis protein CheX|nr:CheC domain protein [Deltaproteobacteria bacterium]
MNFKAEFINPLLEGTVSVLKTMASVEPVPGQPFIKKGGSATGDVSGIVGITGDAEGSMCLTFAKESILFITSQMLGEEQKEINEDVKDAVGELTNMISGDSRRRLQEVGHNFSGSIPSVISGYGHEVKHISRGPVLSIPFTTQAGKFTLEVCFK